MQLNRWVLSLALLGLCGEARADDYKFIPLGTLGGTMSLGTDINNKGRAVGQAQNAAMRWRGFVWQNGSMHDLGTLGGTFSFANRVNEHGNIVGAAATTGDVEVHAVVWGPMGPVDMGTLPGYSRASGNGINKKGAIVGEAHLAPVGGSAVPLSRAFYRNEDGMVALPSLGGRYTRASDLNDRNVAVGAAELETSPEFHAVMWRRQHGVWSVTDLGVLPGLNNSAANSINKKGDIVGWSFDSAFVVAKAFVRTGDELEELVGLGGARSAATGINDHGDISGWSEVFGTGVRHAVLWLDGQVVDLNSYLPAGSAWVLNNASSINNHGDVIGTGTDPLGRTRGFILKLKNHGHDDDGDDD